MEHVIGEGDFTWPRYERVFDRYGSVLLTNGDPSNSNAPDDDFVRLAVPEGKRGRLFAEVLEVHQSDHIGDLFRGFFPGGAVAGERVFLGAGRAMRGGLGDINEAMRLEPDDGRDSDWLDPEALYRLHSCRVRLVFEEA